MEVKDDVDLQSIAFPKKAVFMKFVTASMYNTYTIEIFGVISLSDVKLVAFRSSRNNNLYYMEVIPNKIEFLPIKEFMAKYGDYEYGEYGMDIRDLEDI